MGQLRTRNNAGHKIREMSNLQPHPLKKSKCNDGNTQIKVKEHYGKGFAQVFRSRGGPITYTAERPGNASKKKV